MFSVISDPNAQIGTHEKIHTMYNSHLCNEETTKKIIVKVHYTSHLSRNYPLLTLWFALEPSRLQLASSCTISKQKLIKIQWGLGGFMQRSLKLLHFSHRPHYPELSHPGPPIKRLFWSRIPHLRHSKEFTSRQRTWHHCIRGKTFWKKSHWDTFLKRHSLLTVDT